MLAVSLGMFSSLGDLCMLRNTWQCSGGQWKQFYLFQVLSASLYLWPLDFWKASLIRSYSLGCNLKLTKLRILINYICRIASAYNVTLITGVISHITRFSQVCLQSGREGEDLQVLLQAGILGPWALSTEWLTHLALVAMLRCYLRSGGGKVQPAQAVVVLWASVVLLECSRT